MSPDKNPLHLIRTFTQLVKYLRDELDWPIESENFEDLTFDYAPEELGLNAETAVKIKEIKQLRPLTSKQPWGIFFVNFAPKQLPVVALRRILSTLVIKKRQTANRSQQAAWRLHDLLFISSYGEDAHRDITFAHFAEEHGTGDLPTLRLLGWDDEDTKLKLDFVERELKEKLRWPENESDIVAWRAKWSTAFRLRPREVIKTSQQLAIRLAELARSIRKRANNVLAIESDKGQLRKMHAAFKEALIHDLSTDDFADMYAQTISYGLLTARISRPAGLVADNLSDMVPVTNPFLNDMLETFLTIGGRKGKIDFDELGINDVVQLLRDANMEAVLRDFGDRNPQEDPVIHFYQDFLEQYDKKKQMQRGVFYTPRPVVSFIVRSVHEILQKEFGLQDGLADITTWAEMVRRNKNLVIPQGVSPDESFVQILDPATGTGTFLVEAIDVIHKTMEGRWKKQYHLPLEFERLWNEYVPKHLLPRLHGFELMMAPYAIAHMKIGLKLYETGYHFGSKERAQIYLTNSLEPPSDNKKQREFEEWVPALAHEAKAVNSVKSKQRFTVIIGNPPYSNFGQLNRIPFILDLLEDYKRDLNEKKINLDDDFIKFIRFSQDLLDKTGTGTFGMITNNSFLDGVTHRQMRHCLGQSYHHIWVLNLHGSATLGESCPDGSPDENVFDIRQGVGIILCAKLGSSSTSSPQIAHADLWGIREEKYSALNRMCIDTTPTNRIPFVPDYYFFVPRDFAYRDEYDSCILLRDVFEEDNTGIQTKRDSLTIQFDRTGIRNAVEDVIRLSEANLRTRYNLPEDGRDWQVSSAKKDIGRKIDDRCICRILYRPFDWRWTYFTGKTKGFLAYPRRETMLHMLQTNLALVTLRINGSDEEFVMLVANCLVEKGSLPRGNYSVFPLYIYSDQQAAQAVLGLQAVRHPNFKPSFLRALSARLNVPVSKTDGVPQGFTPEDIFNYSYGVFHSPGYRIRYAEFLKIDFPRLPLTGNLKLFRILARFGGELVALHLLESPKLDKPINTYEGPKNPEVEKPAYTRKTVWLDKEQSCGFKGVPEAVWNFHIGGYQVCEKWLKDRKGRTLSKDDIAHYNKIVVALSETIRLMKKIDEVIDEHGGWPGAFVTDKQKAG
jgi:predicted helicase